MQSLRNKLLELEVVSKIYDIDVICVSEHWLHSEEVNLFTPKGYVPASFFCRTNKRNGGAGIFLKETINFELINLEGFSLELDCELCCVRLIEQNFIITSLYRSPSGDINLFFENFELAMKSIMKKGHLLTVCGDFNIETCNAKSQTSVSFLNLLRSLNLVCTVNEPTHFSACIDNILVNFSENLYKTYSIQDQIADHQANVIDIFLPLNEMNNNSNKKSDSVTYFRKQSKNNISNFVECLKQQRWEIIDTFLSDEVGVDALFDEFFKSYVNLWHFNSPLVRKTATHIQSSKCKKIKWYNDDLKNERNRMLNIFTVYKNLRNNGSEQTNLAYRAYLTTKKSYRSNLLKAKRIAYQEFIETAPNKCKAAWEVISHENTSVKTPEVALDPELVNTFFLDSVAEISNRIPLTNTSMSDLLGEIPVRPNTFEWQEVSPKDIADVVSGLSNSKSMDHFWLSNQVVKKTVQYIQTPLAFILSRCLQFGYFSDLLKISKVVPIYKKGNKHLPENYRPISILPIFSKIFEAIMHKQLYSYFEHFHLISDSQFGFRTGKSTTAAVMQIINHTLTAFDNRESVALSLLDLSKAFDCVPFNSVMIKLKHYGVSDKSCQIISSYLMNRKQYVAVKGTTSSVRSVTIGVPQGSVLGPFFFSVIINDLPINLSTNAIIYADDTTLLARNNNIVDLNAAIQLAETEAKNWFSSNKLHCNSDKTQNILLSLSSNQDPHSVKLLGITIDTKLSWADHIENVCKRVSRVSFLLWKLRELISMEYLRSCYFALFQSHISYGLILWGHSPFVTKILTIQKKVIRTLCRAAPRDHCRPLFIDMKLLTVVNLYIYQVLVYTKSNIQFFTSRQLIHSHFTRNNNRLDLPYHRLSKVGSSYKINCVKFYNKMHVSAQDTSLNNFKNKLINWLQLNPFYSIQEFLDTNVDIVF